LAGTYPDVRGRTDATAAEARRVRIWRTFMMGFDLRTLSTT
jgi:hypothetical protein